MSYDKLKNEIADLQSNIKAKAKAKEMGIFEKIELYTKIYGSSEYKTLKECVKGDPKGDPTPYLDPIPYTERTLYLQILKWDLECYEKLLDFVDKGND